VPTKWRRRRNWLDIELNCFRSLDSDWSTKTGNPY
jgi:hypothetical protein